MAETLHIEDVKNYINLQLAGAAVGQRGMISVRQLYSNIKKYTNMKELDYAEFLIMLNDMRDELNIRPGEIGVDVNYLTLCKPAS